MFVNFLMFRELLDQEACELQVQLQDLLHVLQEMFAMLISSRSVRYLSLHEACSRHACSLKYVPELVSEVREVRVTFF